MSSLLTEILISLVVIAVIGGIIGWLIRGVYIGHREESLEKHLKQSDTALEGSTARIRKLEGNLRKLNTLRTSEKEKLEIRIRELEPLFELVDKRDLRIRELSDELANAQADFQQQLEGLQFNAGARQLLDDDESEVGKLQYELNLANRQKDSAIQRYQAQVRQIEDLKNSVDEKERRIREQEKLATDAAEARSKDLEESVRQVKILERQVKETSDKLAIVENKKQYDVNLMETRVQEAEDKLREARQREVKVEELKSDFLSRENELKKQLSDLHGELTDKQVKIAKLEKRLEPPARRQATIRAVPSAPSPLFNPDNQEDLQQLRGIGPTTEVKLNQLGIKNLMQIASLKEEDFDRICKSLPNFKYLAKRYEWIENAKRMTESSANRASHS